MTKVYKELQRFVHTFNANNIKSDSTDVRVTPPLPDPKKIMRFETEPRSDEEIVYSSKYKFNHDIDILLNNSNETRLAKKSKKEGKNKVPRRQNAWILYRRDKSADPCFSNMKSSIVSVRIRDMWNKESNDVKRLFAALSRLAEEKHIEKHGSDYKYKPSHPQRPKSEQKKEETSGTNLL